MKTKITLVLAIAMLPFFICSQVNTDNTQTVEWYVQNVLVGAGVAITNVQYNGGSAAVSMPQVGQFDNLPSGADVGLSEGMILGSGDITLASQPNTSGGSSLGGTGNSGSDADLQSITLSQIYDECIVEFDFVPDGDSINFNYVFGMDSALTFGEKAIFKNFLIRHGEQLSTKNGFLLYRFMLDSKAENQNKNSGFNFEGH